MFLNLGDNDWSLGIGHGVLHIHVLDTKHQISAMYSFMIKVMYKRIPGIDGDFLWLNFTLDEKS